MFDRRRFNNSVGIRGSALFTASQHAAAGCSGVLGSWAEVVLSSTVPPCIPARRSARSRQDSVQHDAHDAALWKHTLPPGSWQECWLTSLWARALVSMATGHRLPVRLTDGMQMFAVAQSSQFLWHQTWEGWLVCAWGIYHTDCQSVWSHTDWQSVWYTSKKRLPDFHGMTNLQTFHSAGNHLGFFFVLFFFALFTLFLPKILVKIP